MNLAIAAIVVVGWSVMGASLEAAKVITAPAYWALYGAVGVELAGLALRKVKFKRSA